jgi:hypothetical protein
MAALDDLTLAMQSVDQKKVAQARTYAQSFTSVFGSNVPPSYIDLGSFAQVLARETRNAQITDAVEGVLRSLDRAVVAEVHGRKKPGATGISIYFPNSQLYRSAVTGAQSYTAIAERFVNQSLWDDFLAYHYTGRDFDAGDRQVVEPPSGTTTRGPGAGTISVSALQLSDQVAAPGQPVLMSADIEGQNIGYVLLFVGYLDQISNSIFVADSDYLESEESREVDGLYYPDWGSDEFTLEFEWEPLMFAISDGEKSVLASLTPQSYGATPEDAVYSVDGIYTFADEGDTRQARLLFSNGVMRQAFAFTGDGGVGSPREIIPEPGDQFTVLEKWLDLDSSGRVTQVAAQPGQTLTFGDQPFTWKELDAAAGQYVIGYIVEDMDGNAFPVYAPVTVR